MDGLDMYYMANLRDNDYLGGRTYDLSGGGILSLFLHPNPPPCYSLPPD